MIAQVKKIVLFLLLATNSAQTHAMITLTNQTSNKEKINVSVKELKEAYALLKNCKTDEDLAMAYVSDKKLYPMYFVLYKGEIVFDASNFASIKSCKEFLNIQNKKRYLSINGKIIDKTIDNTETICEVQFFSEKYKEAFAQKILLMGSSISNDLQREAFNEKSTRIVVSKILPTIFDIISELLLI